MGSNVFLFNLAYLVGLFVCEHEMEAESSSHNLRECRSYKIVDFPCLLLGYALHCVIRN